MKILLAVASLGFTAAACTSSPPALKPVGCPVGQHEGGDGACVADATCSAGYHDGGDGLCVAAGNCAPGYHDGGGGACVAAGDCAPGYRDGGDGNCVPAGVCVAGLHDDGAGKCVSSGCAPTAYAGANGICTPLIGGLWKPLREFPCDFGPVHASTDGTILATIVSMGGLELSSDGGVTWGTLRKAGQDARARDTTLSADGKHIMAVKPAADCTGTDTGSLFVSNDFGASWTEDTGQTRWGHVTATRDGAKALATGCNANGKQEVLTSVDFGVTWSPTGAPLVMDQLYPVVSPNGTWIVVQAPPDGGVSVSGDVTNLVVSGDWGNTWVMRKTPAVITAAPAFRAYDETLFVFTASSTYSSSDGAATWDQVEAPWHPVAPWNAVVSSDDGRRLVYAAENGDFMVSSDAGQTWVARSRGSEVELWRIVLSGDGSKAFAVIPSAGSIYRLAVADLTR